MRSAHERVRKPVGYLNTIEEVNSGVFAVSSPLALVSHGL
jgi:hypothetical protein